MCVQNFNSFYHLSQEFFIYCFRKLHWLLIFIHDFPVLVNQCIELCILGLNCFSYHAEYDEILLTGSK